MKNLSKLLTLAIITTMVISACTKDGIKQVGDTTLTGKWLFTGSMQSSGGPQYWVKANNNTTFLELKSNGTLTWTGVNDYNKYVVNDSLKLTMSNSADTTKYETFIYKIKGDSLSISPFSPSICIEGCSTHFVKVK